MDNYTINTNYLEIIAGTNLVYDPVYREAAENTEKGNDAGLKYMKNFITSIENLAAKSKDQRITSSAGNIKNFSAIKSVDTVLGFLKKHLGNVDAVKQCATLYDCLEKYQYQYTTGYEKKIRLIELEYESGVYILVTSLSMLMANNMEMVANGTEIKIQKKSATTHGVIDKTLKEFTNQINTSYHKDYLDQLIKQVDNVGPTAESVFDTTFMEDGVVADTISLVSSFFGGLEKLKDHGISLFKKIRSTAFGIIPLIRSALYLKYKKKADTVVSLEQQAQFIDQNIEHLQNQKNMDPAKKEEIIKKQQAMAEAYRKKAEKLRAQLMEGEKDAATAIKKEDPQMKNTNDDFVLESGKNDDDLDTISERDF